jgi:hypothetical protein
MDVDRSTKKGTLMCPAECNQSLRRRVAAILNMAMREAKKIVLHSESVGTLVPINQPMPSPKERLEMFTNAQQLYAHSSCCRTWFVSAFAKHKQRKSHHSVGVMAHQLLLMPGCLVNQAL